MSRQRESLQWRFRMFMLAVLLVSTGCGRGSDHYKAEVKAFQIALSAVTSEASSAATSAYVAEVNYSFSLRTTRTEFEEIPADAVGSVVPKGVRNTEAYYSAMPDTLLNATMEKKLVESMKAMDAYAKVLAKLAGVEAGPKLVTSDIDNMTSLFSSTADFFKNEGVKHPGFITDIDDFKEDVKNLQEWFSAGSTVLSNLKTSLSQSKRGAAIRYGVREGLPHLQDMVIVLGKIAKRLHSLEKLALDAHKEHLADLLVKGRAGAIKLSLADEKIVKQELKGVVIQIQRLEERKESFKKKLEALNKATNDLCKKVGRRYDRSVVALEGVR